MCVQILIKIWASLCCLLPLTVPLDWTPAKKAIYFPLPFFFPCENQSKGFLVCCYKRLLISVLIWRVACNSLCWSGNTVFSALSVPWNLWFLKTQHCLSFVFCRYLTNKYKLTTMTALRAAGNCPNLNHTEGLKTILSTLDYTVRIQRFMGFHLKPTTTWQETLCSAFALTSTPFLKTQTEKQGDLLSIWHGNKVICEWLFCLQQY